MRRLKPLTLAVFFATAFSAPLHAQNLSQLYDAAKNYDATYQAVRAQYAAAQAKLDQAKATFMPTVALQTSGTRTSTESTSTTNASTSGRDTGLFGGTPIERLALHFNKIFIRQPTPFKFNRLKKI